MKPHPTDALSLTFGMIFLGAAGLWTLARQVELDAATVGWLAVAGLIVFGAIGVTHSVVGASRRRHGDDRPQ